MGSDMASTDLCWMPIAPSGLIRPIILAVNPLDPINLWRCTEDF